jgi:predicted nucleic acid-binding protein
MNEALDTSVVLRLLTGEPAPLAEVARAHLARCTAPVAVDALVVGESYFALRHHYGVPHRDAVEALVALVQSERLTCPAGVREALTEALADERDGNHPGVLDRLVLAAARGAERTLLTFDRRLARHEGARLLG